ncbi:MAG: TonB-dependent receptor plug domain-containing protein [Kordiimonas sp.]
MTSLPLLFGASVCALAMAQPIVADDIVNEFHIQGTHIKGAGVRSASDVTVTAAEIEALTPTNFADVLRGLPGIDVHQQGGAGGLTFLSVRGGDPNFAVILIDGVKVNDPTNSRGGAFDLGTLDPSLIEKVEIFYGGYSTVFGSDALSAVINITTKMAATSRGGGINLVTGSGNTLAGHVDVTLPLGKTINFGLNASFQENDHSYFGDEFQRKAVSATMKSSREFSAKNNFGWQATAFYSEGSADTFPEDSGGDRLATLRLPESREYKQKTLGLSSYLKPVESWRTDIAANWLKREEDIWHPGIAPGVLSPVPATNTRTAYERLELTASNSVTITEGISAAFGGSATKETGEMESEIDFGFPLQANYTLERNTHSVFAEAVVRPISVIQLTGGVRYDAAEEKKATTIRAVAQIDLTQNVSLLASYGEGFKLPSFFALGHPLVGNTDLIPERSENYTVQLQGEILAERLSWKLVAYKNVFSNLVDFDPELFTNVNRNRINAKGLEFFTSYTASDEFKVSGSLSYTDIETFDPGVKLRRRPSWKGSLSFTHQPHRSLTFNGKATFNSAYFDSSIPTGVISLPGYNQVDMSVKWQISDTLSVQVIGLNVLNSDFEQAVGFTNQGRSVLFGLKLRH